MLSAVEYLKLWEQRRINATERERNGWKFVAKKLRLKIINESDTFYGLDFEV